MLEIGQLYKHVKFRDVAIKPIELVSTQEGDNPASVYNVMYYNVHYHELGVDDPFFIGVVEHVTINNFNDWKVYYPEQHKGILNEKQK